NGVTTGGSFFSPVLFAQPKGFIGLSADKNALMVTFWTLYAEQSLPGVAAAAMGPTFGSGVISLSATSTELTVRKHDPQAAEVVSATVPGAYVPRGAAEDASGAVLVLTGSGTEVSALWVDLTKGARGQPFAIGTATSVFARPLLGGGAGVRLDASWAGMMTPRDSIRA